MHPSLANTTLDITVEASAPIVVERTKWWGANGTFDEAVSGAGTTAGGSRWLLAEGEMGGARAARTDVSIFNQGAATKVNVTLLFEDGPEATATFAVAAGARLSVPMADAFPSAEGRRFSVLVEGADPTASPSWIAQSSGAAPMRRAPPVRTARRRACGNPHLDLLDRGRDTHGMPGRSFS